MMDPAIETESLLGTSVAISISKKSDHTNGELLKESASETIKCERDPKRKIGRCFKVGSIDEGCVSDADFEVRKFLIRIRKKIIHSSFQPCL